MFDVGDKSSFDIGLGGPKDHVVSFFFNSDDFFSKLHHLICSISHGLIYPLYQSPVALT